VPSLALPLAEEVSLPTVPAVVEYVNAVLETGSFSISWT
jgi:hypothetical protein